jgi:putative flippase GtrA
VTRGQIRELAVFLVCGCAAVLTDGVTYFLLSGWSVSHPVAKAVSFVTGSAVAYFANKTFTFRVQDPEGTDRWGRVVRFSGLYLSTLGANVLVNQLALTLFSDLLDGRVAGFAFLCATGMSTVLNYLGQKFWVFRSVGARPA